MRWLHAGDRERARRDPANDERPRQPDRPPGRGGVAGREHRPRLPHRPAVGAGLPRLSVRLGPVCRRRRAGDGQAAALSRRCRLRGDERHAAVGGRLVRQRDRYRPGAARLLPLAVCADRVAGRRLCRPAILPFGGPRHHGPPHEHGCADLARRAAGARHVGRRNAEPCRTRLFRFGPHAADLPAHRTNARTSNAAAHPGGRRQPCRSARGDSNEIREPARTRRSAGRFHPAGRHRAGAAR